MKKYFVAGGAGFIGSNLVKTLLLDPEECKVTVYDNYSSGSCDLLKEIEGNENLLVIKDDIKNIDALKIAIEGADTVYHFASNPDISKALTQPDIDFWEGTYLTNNILEAMRVAQVKNFIYASGSGVYGEAGLIDLPEDYSPMMPVSTYGASKLSGEAQACSYSHMFDMNVAVFRFANVVGCNQTHGVGLDFVSKLGKDPGKLDILGDGTQSKSYIYVEDVISAMRMIEKTKLKDFSVYNVSTQDHITVNEIADIAVNVMGLDSVEYRYSGGDRGWKGDVPVVRINSDKIRALGWKSTRTSKEAIEESVEVMVCGGSKS
jgi:UDP-glucose 4-epimerase